MHSVVLFIRKELFHVEPADRAGSVSLKPVLEAVYVKVVLAGEEPDDLVFGKFLDTDDTATRGLAYSLLDQLFLEALGQSHVNLSFLRKFFHHEGHFHVGVQPLLLVLHVLMVQNNSLELVVLLLLVDIESYGRRGVRILVSLPNQDD